jgi:general secretion pathway protein G
MKKAFTTLELVFVIVVLGILASIALPKLWVTRDDAVVVKVRSDVSTIRSSISTKYGKNIMEGRDECPSLEKDSNDNQLFEGVLTYPIKKNSGAVKWDGNGSDYNVTINGKVITFKYLNNSENNCKFECKDNCSVIGE